MDQVESLFAQHRVRLGAITRYDLGPYRLCEELSLLERLGGKLLVCGAARHDGDSEEKRVRKFVETMKSHVERAEENGVTIAIENHSGTILNTPSAIRHFAEYATSPNLGVALAPYHLPQDPQVIARLIEDLGDKLVFFQAWQHGLGCSKKLPKAEELTQLPGRGKLDFAPLLAALHKINYQRYTEIFMHPVPRGVPIRDSTNAVTNEIVRAREYLERCLAEVPRRSGVQLRGRRLLLEHCPSSCIEEPQWLNTIKKFSSSSATRRKPWIRFIRTIDSKSRNFYPLSLGQSGSRIKWYCTR